MGASQHLTAHVPRITTVSPLQVTVAFRRASPACCTSRRSSIHASTGNVACRRTTPLVESPGGAHAIHYGLMSTKKGGFSKYKMGCKRRKLCRSREDCTRGSSIESLPIGLRRFAVHLSRRLRQNGVAVIAIIRAYHILR